MSESEGTAPTAQFVENVVRHQHDLVRFLRALGLRGTDIDEVQQQTMMLVWEKWDEFDRSRTFLPWLLKFAHLEVLKLRQKRAADRLVFSDELLGAIAADAQQNVRLFESQLEPLRNCLKRLDPSEYELVFAKYAQGLSAAELADRARTTAKAIYRRLDRIRLLLTDCVRRQLIQPDT